ncbi:alpha-2-macroglobulin family protein [Rhodanobacter glycinis]|uniref:Alpha-2-macroglobulin family protein n=1 Tax=Rhodanobacter glycinis TaxID=582702 RepID=A0A502BW50_9GAMM|nr:alpha-2-macroglobulin [Rhodanobacter glycinis]TPG04688.1 alpha-2-macroglobulin family protein [Rhodanobacter glycinis]
MDLLRFLLMLPVRLVRSLFHLLGSILRPLIGNVSWAAPGWAPATGAAIRRRPRQFAGGLLAALILLVGGWFGWQWYQHRPRPVEPERITFEVKAPAITEYAAQADGNPKITIHPLEIDFSRSAAPIELVGKVVGKGIAMQPALKGEWNWLDDHTLRFVPAEDWPVGVHVKVQFDVTQTFAPHVLMADDHLTFDLPKFAATFGNGEFYQDPQDATAKKTIVPVNFNYPVDAAQFEKRIAIALADKDGKFGTPLKFTVTYDAFKLNAWVHSQPLDLPRDDSAVLLKLRDGVRSSRGGDGTRDPLQTSVHVPGLYSLTIQDISPTLVDNDKYEPEQVLVANVSGSVRGSDVAGLTKAWILPTRKVGADQSGGDAPYAWDVSEVSEAVLRQSQPLSLALVPTENDYAELQSFKYHATPGQQVYVRIGAGLKSFGGYVLGKPTGQTFSVPDYPKLLRFMADGSLLSLSGSKRISVVSRNMPGMQLEIGRVLPDQLQHLVSLNQGTYTHPELVYGFSEDHIVERFEQKSAFPKADPGKAHYEGVDLGQYLKEGKRGVFLLHLSGYDPVVEAKKAAAAAKARAKALQGTAPAAGDEPASAVTTSTADAVTSSDSSAGDDAANSRNDNDSDESAETPMPTDTRLIVVTDLGMLVKRSLDGSQDVFVQSIHTGQPVADASVSVLAVNGATLYTQSSSADGVVHFPTFKGLQREKKPVMYVVKKGDDLSFLPIEGSDRQLDYSRFDIGGEPNAASQGQLSAYLFSDRGIYRPGDLFHIGLIVRAASWSRNVAGIPLQAEIVDPRGVTVKQQALTMDASGFGELDYTPTETAPTGTWTVNLYIVRDGKADAQIGTTTIQVKEFLPDRMKVEAKLSQQVPEGWVKPEQLKGIVDVQNLFGTPAADRRVEASLTLRPAWPAFHSWPDYHFYDVRRARDGYEESLQDGKTDDKGHAEFDLDLKKYADATYQLYFLSKAYEAEGGRSVAAAVQTLVSSNDWLVGYKAVDNLDYITRDSPRTVRLVAINPQARAFALNDLKAQLIERRYVSVLTKQDSGVYKYESKLKEIPISEQPLAIPAAGMDYPLPTDRPGNYALVIRRADRTEVNRIEYAVAGNANVTRSLDRNAELQLNLSKPDYAQGEPVEIAIRAPYAGSGLITIERDKVYAHAWFHADTTSSVQHITVPADFEGNGYINVQYIRDPSSDEVFMSPLSYGVVPFSVNLDARRNPITVDAPALVKPGETVTFRLHSTQPTRAVVFAVDEGILQVARYKLGDPLKFFFRKRMLEVGTSQILDLILPDFEKLMAMAAPGGDADGAIGRQLNPFKRKRDKPVVYWSGIIDVNGDKDFSYTVPDYFNGKLRVMAMSVSSDRIGTYEGSTTVRGDFVLSSNVPTTLAPGDQAQISVGVANNLTGLNGKQVPVAVTLKTGPQLQVVGSATQSLTLGELREGVAVFHVKATDVLGSGNLTFSAGYGGKTAKQAVDLSVRPASAYRTQIDVGRVAPGSQEDLPNLRKLYDAYASRDAAFSTVPIVLAQGLTTYLINYQNYCSEQLVSAAMPRLVVAKWPAAPMFAKALQPAFSEKKLGNDEALAQFLDVLHSRQNGQGGFGVWTATPDAEPFVSAYAMHFLLEAHDRGVAVPKDMLDAGNKYLHQLAADESLDSLDELRQRAYAVYLLTRQGNVTTNDLAAVQKRLQDAFPNDWKNDLAAAWLAASYELLKQDKEANQLIAGPQKALERKLAKESYVYSYYYDPLTRDASVLYLLSKYFPDRAKALSPQVMENIVWPLAHNQFNTLSSSMTILALDAYAAQNAGGLDKLGIDEVRADGSARSIAAMQANLVQAGSWDAAAARVRFTNGSSLPAWRVTSQGGYDRDAPAKAIKDGIEIVREYTDSKGKPLDKIDVGDEIDVHVKIRATGDQGVGNVAIVDLLPGGFEPVIEPPAPVTDQQTADADNGADGSGADEGGDSEVKPATWRSPIGLSTSTWQPDYADIREDRVVIYGTATPDVREFVYRIKASNAGTFIVPPAYGESMYDRSVQARSPGGGTLTVVSKP